MDDEQYHNRRCHEQVADVEPGEVVEDSVQDGALHNEPYLMNLIDGLMNLVLWG